MVNVKRLGENRFKKLIFEIIAFEKKLNLKCLILRNAFDPI